MKRKRKAAPLPDRRIVLKHPNANVLHSTGRKLSRKRKIIHQVHHLMKTTTEHTLAGVLESYQHSSVVNSRHGGTKILRFLQANLPSNAQSRLRLLDVGAIHGKTFASMHNVIIDAIDLNPMSPSVRKQDFLGMDVSTKYDIVALSLVLNFSPNPVDRGRMLVQAKQLLTHHGMLLLVLPLACVANSRYLTHDHLVELSQCLGLKCAQHNVTKRLAMYILSNSTVTNSGMPRDSFGRKIVLNDGPRQFCAHSGLERDRNISCNMSQHFGMGIAALAPQLTTIVSHTITSRKPVAELLPSNPFLHDAIVGLAIGLSTGSVSYIGQQRAIFGHPLNLKIDSSERRNFWKSMARDGAGFAAFFAVYEPVRASAWKRVANSMGITGDNMSPPRSLAAAVGTICVAGSVSSLAYELASFPFRNRISLGRNLLRSVSAGIWIMCLLEFIEGGLFEKKRWPNP
ncbi:hypothetical protein SeMB42_g05809 [Synchytrium endobioticum]|uniref:25S rRNA adenine-N(1) methyltransferase n=1 Tax=Synchytrium endobioticum TaxID=286115 RepID=A0A507CP90_9FUNG|nr:hypothetical protein SeMB42_g05809 [Synchytrium endobioticum]